MTEGWILTPFPDQQAYPALVSSLSGDFPETFSFCASTSSLLVWSSVVLWNFREKKLLLSVANFWLWGKKEFSIPLPQCEALWYVSTALIYLTCFGVHAEWMSFVFDSMAFWAKSTFAACPGDRAILPCYSVNVYTGPGFMVAAG